MTDLELIVNRGLLRYAVGRALVCPTCGRILDCGRAVLVTVRRRPGGAGIACGRCFDRTLAVVGPSYRRALAEGAEVLDGRVLWGRQKRLRKVAA